jgi:hypothetical protein
MSAQMTTTLDSLAQDLTRLGWQQVPGPADVPSISPNAPFFFVAPPNPGHEEEGRNLCLYHLPTPEGIKANAWSDFIMVFREDSADQRVIGATVEDLAGGVTWGVWGWSDLRDSFEWGEKVIKRVLRYWDEEMYLGDSDSSMII